MGNSIGPIRVEYIFTDQIMNKDILSFLNPYLLPRYGTFFLLFMDLPV